VNSFFPSSSLFPCAPFASSPPPPAQGVVDASPPIVLGSLPLRSVFSRKIEPFFPTNRIPRLFLSFPLSELCSRRSNVSVDGHEEPPRRPCTRAVFFSPFFFPRQLLRHREDRLPSLAPLTAKIRYARIFFPSPPSLFSGQVP